MTTEHGHHYGGTTETISSMEAVARAWADAGHAEAGLCLAQALKYLSRPGKGQPDVDLQKAQDYLTRARTWLGGGKPSWTLDPPKTCAKCGEGGVLREVCIVCVPSASGDY